AASSTAGGSASQRVSQRAAKPAARRFASLNATSAGELERVEERHVFHERGVELGGGEVPPLGGELPLAPRNGSSSTARPGSTWSRGENLAVDAAKSAT